MLAVDVRQLTRTYVVPEREAGLGAALRSVVRRRTRAVEAVAEVSFALQPGEFVGFVGPNGAGKTTTLKMLSGLLFPPPARRGCWATCRRSASARSSVASPW